MEVKLRSSQYNGAYERIICIDGVDFIVLFDYYPHEVGYNDEQGHNEYIEIIDVFYKTEGLSSLQIYEIDCSMQEDLFKNELESKILELLNNKHKEKYEFSI
jgi:hypothetical protein